MPRAKKTTDVEQLDTESVAIVGVQDSRVVAAFDEAIEAAKAEIARVDERAEYTITVLTQAIRTQAAVAKGRVLLQLRERFDAAPEYEGMWRKFLTECAVSEPVVYQWMNAARTVEAASPLFGEEMLLQMSYKTLNTIQQLPSSAQADVLATAQETGTVPTIKAVTELAKAPEVKLDKATEDLAAALAKRNAAKQKLEEVKADPEVSSRAQDAAQCAANNADITVKRLEETIEQLRSQVAEDKIKSEQAAKESERLNAELELLKFDDDAARDQRVKRVGNTLIVQLPAVLSDLQKYIAEKEHYDTKVVGSLDNSIETLINFLKPLYA
jgi:hypothetical protein